MAEYNPSKIIKDGNTYNFRDTTKIPLAGSNQISGDLIPATDNSIDVGSSAKNIKTLYSKNIIVSGAGNGLRLNNSSEAMHIECSPGASIDLCGKDYTYSNNQGKFILTAFDGNIYMPLVGSSSGTLIWGSKNVAMQEDVVPRSGGSVMTGTNIGRVDGTSSLNICGGAIWSDGGYVSLRGKNIDLPNLKGTVEIGVNSTNFKHMVLYPNGTWTWDGTACQITSDQRYKQQIAEIDDKLLDAWQDVELSQFKYNDAVKEKSDNARLHTGYVVQQIDEACKKHNVDISAYGLYCHEEYPEETEEVEVEQADGTKVKETKVIREASEHYSLRYTEALIVECAYLRKKLKELTARIEQLESSK